MAHSLMGRCGFYCGPCGCRTEMGCPGCQATEGKLFWGECRVATCCIAKGHDHCGQCQESPCEALNEVAYHPEHGDNGARLLNLKAWNEMGYDAWLREKNERS